MFATCYVCGGTEWITRVGSLRDAPSIGVVECRDCGLVVPAGAPQVAIDYWAGTMHGDAPIDLAEWRNSCAEDDQRRVKAVQSLLNAGDAVLDIGCGSGGFIHEMKRVGVPTFGIELDSVACDFLNSEGLSVWPDLAQMPESKRQEVQVATMFHVLEHLRDPRVFLREALEALPNVRLFVIEVPCAEDPLLTLYESEAFSCFTYWSHHEHLHSKRSLESVFWGIFDSIEVSRLQRYGLANHLGWLSRGKPGGQVKMSWLERSPADVEYRSEVIAQGFSDTLWAVALISPNSAGR